MTFEPQDITDLRLVTLAQLALNGPWELSLAHDRPYGMVIWVTRGQGVALLDGARSGVGIHNALYIPAHHLVSLDMARQGYGQAVLIPAASDLMLPDRPHHLRIRETGAQTELTALFEAMGREQTAARPLCQSALDAYGALIAIWLRRQIGAPPVPAASTEDTAARRLVRAYCARLCGPQPVLGTMATHAQALGVTPTHLTRVCRSETGKTAAALLTDRQLHAARRLLSMTPVPVRDIARHLGFGSPAYFTRFIQNHCGQTPTALRWATRRNPL